MKKIPVLIMMVCFAAMLCGCGGNSTPAADAAYTQPETTVGREMETADEPVAEAKISEEQTIKANTPKPADTKPKTDKADVGDKAEETHSEPTKAPTQSTAPEAAFVTIGIDCKSILDNYDKLEKALRDERFVPSDGIILKDTTITLSGGETAYDILQRVCKNNNILVECSYAPADGAAYVEGINNIYEFSCGSLSGWEYSVNGVFTSQSCSAYKVSDGDVIRFRYTCDLGRDIGNNVR